MIECAGGRGVSPWVGREEEIGVVLNEDEGKEEEREDEGIEVNRLLGVRDKIEMAESDSPEIGIEDLS